MEKGRDGLMMEVYSSEDTRMTGELKGSSMCCKEMALIYFKSGEIYKEISKGHKIV